MHHILDPRDGLPARSPWRTASVASATCLEANIACTAAIVLGDDAIGWLDRHELPARLVDINGDAHVVGGWPR
jgi:FAD:protein FMN transferase